MFLTVKDLKKSYGSGSTKVEVLKGINFEVQKGEICVLLGPSGSGKSTLLNIIGGIDDAASLKSDEVYVTYGYAEKFQIKKGDKITLKEKYEDKEYEFTVKGMYNYPSSFAAFMSDEALKNVE